MNNRMTGLKITAILLAMLLALSGAAGAFAGTDGKGEGPGTDGTVVRVGTVDELLDAIAPGTRIELAPGEYDLTQAAGYGGPGGASYTWNDAGDGWELVILDADGLTLCGDPEAETSIVTRPRYANVIRFENCADLTVEHLTVGHTEEPGFCSGGVLNFEGCRDVTVNRCSLYGCGITGVTAYRCNALRVTESEIYECSEYGVEAVDSRDVRIEGCSLHDLADDRNDYSDGAAWSVFRADTCDGFAVVGSTVTSNNASCLLDASYTRGAVFVSTLVSDNRFDDLVFETDQYPICVDGCLFRDNAFERWFRSVTPAPVLADGTPADAETLKGMTLREVDADEARGALSAAPGASDVEVPAGGTITVSDIDGFLAAIGSDRTILLEDGSYNLTDASGYGYEGGPHHYWRGDYDGSQLIIYGVSGLTIRSASGDAGAVTLSTRPRYANVLNFENCRDITLSDFTCGHTEEPGECSGGVLYFESCGGITVDAMDLYGCGTLGLECWQCSDVTVSGCSIHDCTQGAVSMTYTDGVEFSRCDIRDVPSPMLMFYLCGDLVWNGAPVSEDNFDLDAEGNLVPYSYDW